MNGLERIERVELRTLLNDISDKVFEKVVVFVEDLLREAFDEGYRAGNYDGQNGG